MSRGILHIVKKYLERNAGLSVIVPVTNMSGKLENFRSWIEKIWPYEIQVIIVHDIRELNTSRELIEIISNNNQNKIDLIEGQFGSPGTTRNMGLGSIKFDWVAFWDSDDLPCIENVMKAISQVNDFDYDCIVGNFLVADINSDTYTVKKLSAGYIEDIGMNPGIWRFIFKYETLKSTSFVNYLMAEDQVFLAHYFSTQRKIYISHEILYEYCVGSPTQLTRNKKAINDLPRAMKAIAHLSSAETQNVFLNYLFITRMLLTALKLGSISCKINALIQWFSVILFFSSNKKVSLIRAARVVFKNVFTHEKQIIG